MRIILYRENSQSGSHSALSACEEFALFSVSEVIIYIYIYIYNALLIYF